MAEQQHHSRAFIPGGTDVQYRLLVEAVTDYAIYMLTREGNVASWNAGAARIKQYSAEEVVGSHFSRFYPPEDRREGDPQRGLETAARNGRFEKEGWRIRKDGSRFWANAIIDAIYDETGEVIGFAKITRDITDKKLAQEEFEAAREALFQAQKMEAIGRLSGGIAHDFNNLLMAIHSSLELAHRRLPEDPKLRRLLNNASQGANRGAALTQRMLAFARRQTLKRQNIAVSNLLDGLKELVRHALGATIEVKFDIANDVDSIVADVNQLESAILNVVMNARDAMPAGGALFISARRVAVARGTDKELPHDVYVCLTITDTGMGMDGDTLMHATEPFFTTKGIGKGAGLGLPQVQGLLQQMGGRFILRSTLGVGTVAEFWIPSADSASVPEIHAMTPPTKPTPETRRLRILAVDDDALVLMNTVDMLEELGHQVAEAASGKQALEVLRQQPPFDVIVTDMAMPQMNGLEFAREARIDCPATPIVLATGYADVPDRAGLPMVLLNKPYGIDDLTRAIAEAIGG